MRAALLLAAALLVLTSPGPAVAGGHGGYGYSVPRHTYPRSQAAKDAFKRAHPCPSTGRSSGACPGYVIDHVIPLKRGGADQPFNMQWPTIEDAKAKDKWE